MGDLQQEGIAGKNFQTVVTLIVWNSSNSLTSHENIGKLDGVAFIIANFPRDGRFILRTKEGWD